VGTDPSPTPETRPATVDVWRAHLALPPDELSRISDCLDEAERQRAARFRFARDRDRFRAARGLLRHILAPYLNTAPGRIRFGYTPEGKPFLLEHPDIHFNLSHADEVLVVGVARGRELGVDVERMFSEAVMAQVSGAVLSNPERLVIGGLSAAERREWFVRLWTRKEAYIKADGRGMSLRLEGIDVSTRPNRVRLLGNASNDWGVCERWAVRELAVAPGYAAALVSEGLDWEVAYLDWPSGAR
jgi:4'-phosphopantetheinyl transferase